jgi:F-box interacting protein
MHNTRAEPLLAVNSVNDLSILRLIDMDGNVVRVIRNTSFIFELVCTSPDNLVCVIGVSHSETEVIDIATGEVFRTGQKGYFMGFGRAVPSGVYKMVCIGPHTSEFLTVGDGVGWRTKYSPPPNKISYNSRPLALNGVLHLMSASHMNRDNVLCLDLESEKWKKGITGPPNVELHQHAVSLAELNGMLCMVQPELGSTYHVCTSIWLLIDSDKGTWIKAYSIFLDPSTYCRMVPLRILRDGGKLLFYLKHEFRGLPVLQIYDPYQGTCRDASKMLSGNNSRSIGLCSLPLENFLSVKN